MSYHDDKPRNAPNSKRRMINDPLSAAEKSRLAENELIIGQGVKAFVAVGLALLEIREGQLYRENHKTFEDYLQKRWKMGRAHGYRMIEAAEVVENLSPNGRQIIENERQARALAMVPQHLRAEVLEAVQDAGSELTEQNITKAVNTLLDKKRQEAKEREASGQAEEDEEEIEEEGEATDESREAEAQEPTAATKPSQAESTRASTLRGAAKRFEKERMYLSRGLEHLRLALKDLRKVEASDFKTKKAREAARESLEEAEAVFSTVLGLAMLAEAS